MEKDEDPSQPQLLPLTKYGSIPTQSNQPNEEDVQDLRLPLEPDDEDKHGEIPDPKDTGKTEEGKVSVLQLFRFADKTDVILITFGTFFALIGGSVFPINLFVFSRVLSTFTTAAANYSSNAGNGTNPFSNAFEMMTPLVIAFCCIGVAALVVFYVMMTMWSLTAERQIQRIRKQFFRSVMKQDIGWFDCKKTGEMTARFAEDAQSIMEAFGDKLALFLQLSFTWVVSTIIAITLQWDVALVALSVTPILIAVTGTLLKHARNVRKKELALYGKAGRVAEEVIGAIRTVHAFQGQEKESKRYISNLQRAKNIAVKKGVILGWANATFYLVVLGDTCLALGYGAYRLQTGDIDPGNIVPILFNVLLGAFSLGRAFPYFQVLSLGLTSAAAVYDIIDAVPAIDSDKGIIPDTMHGTVELCNVSFYYPSRSSVRVLTDLSLSVPRGALVALVGPSGCGKSTTVNLIQRFYDVSGGQIFVDGRDVRELNLKWLRHHIGVVSQEPVLFDTTIKENIRYGNMDVTDEGIEKAAKQANAHDFITQLPMGYETMVGGQGQQLSGGQKQRIAIARALVRNPQILLLDEATSALDSESEALVQNALEMAGHGRTTIVIAHRLSTVKDADMIVVLNEGQVVEKGTHEQLLAENELYANLVKLQNMQLNNNESPLEKSTSQLDDVMEEEGHVQFLKQPSSTADVRKRSTASQQGVKENGSTMTKDEEAEELGSLKMILRTNSQEWMYLLLGLFSAFICGTILPAYAFALSEFIRIVSTTTTPEEIMNSTLILIGGLISVLVVTSVAKVLQEFAFSKSGAALTARVRGMAFTSIVNQDMDFFDDPEYSIGYLTTRLATDAQDLQSMTSQVGFLLEAVTNVILAILIAFIYAWKLALVMVWFVPIMAGAGIVQGQFFRGVAKFDKQSLQEAGKVCLESTDNIRTVSSLGIQNVFIGKYENIVRSLYKGGVRMSHIRGISYGAAQCILFFGYATCFGFGSYLLQRGELTFFEIVRVLIVLLYGGREGGRTLTSLEDYRRGKMAAGRLFGLIRRQPSISTTDKSGQTLSTFSGNIAFDAVTFHYKGRPNTTVLNNLKLRLQEGETLALVGPSGGGKSTIIQLLERFYDVDAGVVTADSSPLQDLNLEWWRAQLALVSQEPTLFDASISYNIAYGDNSREVRMKEIIAAANMADIHGFIKALPKGYGTNVGSKGTQLSGGQKQRIAIARALIRNPKILLLDEATSALDSESERIVQETLDKAREGRTCIIIAHRLSTIQNADKIAVIKHGAVVELGSHSELLAQKGVYASLVQSQNSKRRQSTALLG